MSSAGVSVPKRGRPRDDIGFGRIKLKRDVRIPYLEFQERISWTLQQDSQ